jgi:hypothetical protein
MLQLFFTILIIGLVVGVAIVRIVRYYKNPLQECEGCDQHCGVCSLEEFKKEIENKRSQKTNRINK